MFCQNAAKTAMTFTTKDRAGAKREQSRAETSREEQSAAEQRRAEQGGEERTASKDETRA